MEAGKLRHRLELQAPTDEAEGDTGNPDTSYTQAAIVWGSVEPLSVTERLRAEQVAATASHLVRIRYREGITHKWRILFGTRQFAIESIMQPEMRTIEIRMLVREETT